MGTLNSLIVAYGDKIGPSAYEVIIVELSALIRFPRLSLPSVYLFIFSSLIPYCHGYKFLQYFPNSNSNGLPLSVIQTYT